MILCIRTDMVPEGGTFLQAINQGESYMLRRMIMRMANERTLGSQAGERRKRIARQQGFTLLEILVVLTIMGFLIAMVAPRLAGISGDAVDTVCDSNQNRMITYMSSFFEKTNRFPTKLTNLVEETAAGAYQIPAVSDDDPDNGAETLASEFFARNHFVIHYLNENEAAELKNMGIVKVLNLNAYDAYVEDGSAIKSGYDETAATGPNDVDLQASVTKAPTMEEADVAEGLAVAMVGAGSANITDAPAAVAGLTERGWGEPDWFGRIVLGMGPECSLVTSGIVANAAHCPGGIQNADNVTYNDYNLVIPRLPATATRMATVTNVTDYEAASTDTIELAAVAYDDEPGATYDFADTANDDHLRTRVFTINEAQESWQYATQCPEGHMYPEDDGEFWGVSLNGDQILD
jgi:prepilin-type N-terminal cleavage/methylation domain-containing protein